MLALGWFGASWFAFHVFATYWVLAGISSLPAVVFVVAGFKAVVGRARRPRLLGMAAISAVLAPLFAFMDLSAWPWGSGGDFFQPAYLTIWGRVYGVGLAGVLLGFLLRGPPTDWRRSPGRADDPFDSRDGQIGT